MSKTTTIAGALLGSLLVATPALALSVSATASANVKVGSTTVSAATQTKITTAKSRASQEITRRVNILTQLNTDVQAMVKVSADDKTAIANKVQSEISALNSLNAKIQADTDITTLKADIHSITIDYRVFMLVVPQGKIEVAADRVQTIAANYTKLSATLQSRISQAPSGTNTTQVNAWLSDMNTQVANANTQAQAAASLVANLQPDQGSASLQASNKTALQNAHADLKAALADLKIARKDAGDTVKAIESWHDSTSVSTTVNAQ